MHISPVPESKNRTYSIMLVATAAVGSLAASSCQQQARQHLPGAPSLPSIIMIDK